MPGATIALPRGFSLWAILGSSPVTSSGNPRHRTRKSIAMSEVTLKCELAQEFSEWFSIWSDLLHVRQALYGRRQIEDTGANLFVRRAIWEGAVISYGRCYVTGRRRSLLRKYKEGMTLEQRNRHDETIHWRDKHVGHRVDQALEVATTVAEVDTAGTLLKVSGRITPTVSPSQVAAQELEDLAEVLKDMVWEKELIPLELKIRDSYATPPAFK